MTTADESNPSLEDMDAVRRKLKQLAREGRIDELIEMVVDLLLQVRDDNTALQARLRASLRALYGRRSEKVSREQLELAFDKLGDDVPDSALDALGEKPSDEPIEQPPNKPRPARPRKGRNPLPPGLPRETNEVRVVESERACGACGADKTTIGFVRSEILEFVPATFKVIEERREKLACPQCEAGVVVAESEKVRDRGRPGPGLLAQLLVGKHADSLPIYRQAQIFERYGVKLPASTLGEWLAFGIAVLRPIAWEIKRRVFCSPYIFLDDTTLRVQDRKDPRGIRKGRLWCAVASDTPFVAFMYKPDWSAEHAADFLRGFRGFVHGDGYAGYAASLGPPGGEELVVPHDRRLGCGMHVRRKFESASDGGEVRALVALAYFRKLYAIEARCKDEGLSHDQRLERRRELSLPVLKELYQWVEQLHPSLAPGMALHKATTYALNQREYFERCFTDGRFEIDNGEAERQIRPLKLGEKNYLFAGSENGAVDIADARTIINTCKRAGVDPLAYATDVIMKLQRGWPRSRIAELLPDRWQPTDVALAAE